MKRYRGLTLSLLFTIAISCGPSQAFFSPSLGTMSGLVKGLQQVAIGMMVLWGGQSALPVDDNILFFTQNMHYQSGYSIHSMEIMSDDSILLAGDITHNNLDKQAVLMKYAANYSFLWMTYIGGSFLQRISHTALLSDESIVLGGGTTRGGLIRCDTDDGHIIWQQAFNISEYNNIRFLIPTLDGGFGTSFLVDSNMVFATYTKEGQRQKMYLIEGDFSSILDLPIQQIGPEDFIVIATSTLPGNSLFFIVIMRIKLQNGVVWKHYIESLFTEAVTAMTISNQGTILIAGSVNSESLICEFDFNGVLLSRKKRSMFSLTRDIIPTNDGGFATIGRELHMNVLSAVFTRFNSTGPIWGRYIEHNQKSGGNSIVQKSDGSFIAVGLLRDSFSSFLSKISDEPNIGGCMTPYTPIFVETMGEVVVKNATHINVTEAFYTTIPLNLIQNFVIPNESISCLGTFAPTMETMSPTLSTLSPSFSPTTARPTHSPSQSPTRQPTIPTTPPTKAPTRNFSPQIIGNISDQKAIVDKFFTYHLKVNEIFSDDQDDVEELRISTSQVGLFGLLPPWLKFNQTTKDYTGTPKAELSHPIRVNIFDRKGARAEKDVLFTIKVVDEPTDSTLRDLGTPLGITLVALAFCLVLAIIGCMMIYLPKKCKGKQGTNKNIQNPKTKTKLKKQTEARSKQKSYKKPKSNTTKMEMDTQISMNAEMYAKINADIEMDVFIGHHGVTAYGFYDEAEGD